MSPGVHDSECKYVCWRYYNHPAHLSVRSVGAMVMRHNTDQIVEQISPCVRWKSWEMHEKFPQQHYEFCLVLFRGHLFQEPSEEYLRIVDHTFPYELSCKPAHWMTVHRCYGRVVQKSNQLWEIVEILFFSDNLDGGTTYYRSHSILSKNQFSFTD